MNAVSMFSNCGAGDVGYAAAGFRFRVMSELVEKRLAVAVLNHPGAVPVAGDLRRTWPNVVDSFREACDLSSPVLLSGCPPCQGMSSARGGRGKEDDPDASARDDRNLLALPIAHATNELRPTFVVVENVPAFLRRKVWDPAGGDPVSAARILCNRLERDYRAYAALLDLCEFGVPQTRKRAFLVFVRRGSAALDRLEETGATPFPAPTHGTTDLPGVVALGDALEASGLPSLDSASPEAARSEGNPMHRVPVWDDRRYDMVAAIEPGSGRSAWETDHCDRCGRSGIESHEPTCPDCEALLLRPVTKGRSGSWRLVKGFRNSSYRRMAPDLPAATVTTASGHIGSDRTIHPWENRVLSPAECAFLQTLPSDFDWGDSIDSWGHTPVREMIGEAVPPRFTELHGRVLAALADGRDCPATLMQDDVRCRSGLSKLRGG